MPSKRIEVANQDDSDISDDEEDDEEPQFFDLDEMETVSSGGNHFRKIITSSKEGSLLLLSVGVVWAYRLK